jgi:hypothetical protein
MRRAAAFRIAHEEQRMMINAQALRIGDKAPEFLVETAEGSLSLRQLAAGYRKLILTTQDSYRYHPN